MKLPLLSLSLSLVVLTPLRADVVAEWKFDAKENAGENGVIPLDQAAPDASKESVLKGETSYNAGPTNLGDKWQAFLQNGYLDAGTGGTNQQGLVTKNTSEDSSHPNNYYRNYFGFAGLGTGGYGGTAYFVLSPTSNWSGDNARRCITGTGVHPYQIYPNAGWIKLGVSSSGDGDGTKELYFTAARGDGTDKLVCKSAIPLESVAWNPGTWYFIAVTWQDDAPPLLYVREMSPKGPAESPAAIIGTVTGNPLSGTDAPADTSLTVGAFLSQHGNGEETTEGVGAQIAYARFDNVPAPKEEVEKIFLSLGQK